VNESSNIDEDGVMTLSVIYTCSFNVPDVEIIIKEGYEALRLMIISD